MLYKVLVIATPVLSFISAVLLILLFLFGLVLIAETIIYKGYMRAASAFIMATSTCYAFHHLI